MNKQQLAARIWASANKMRSKIEASEYKDYILGFIFYKYLSDKEEQFMLSEGGMKPEELPYIQEQDQEIVQYCQTNIGYFIAYDNLFSTWLNMGSDFSVQNVTMALSAFERLINENYKKLFEGIFSSLSVGLSKLGSTAAQQSKAILDLLALIKDIPTDGRQGYDILGFIYEYLISQFAANAGKKAGEFYTPHEVSVLMSEIVAGHLKNRKNISIYDPTSGSGSLLLNIGQAVSRHTNDKDNIHYYAQELKSATYNLTRMNLVMRGIKPGNIDVRNADTLEEDWPRDERTSAPTLYLDAVVSNPPYSQPWNPNGKDLDPRYRYGVAPKGKADYAFLLHDLYHLKPDGIMTIVLPHGVLFRGDAAKDEAEGVIRKNLIENNHLDAVIGLPADIFFGTGIATIILVLCQKRDRDDVLFIDASKGFIKSGKKNKLRASDIRRIVDTYEERLDIDKFSRRVSREEIRENGYNLNIPRYVDSSDAAETWDLYATMYGAIPNREIDSLPYWSYLPTLRNSLFEPINDTHSRPRLENGTRMLIETDQSYHQLTQAYDQTMSDLVQFLDKELLQSIQTVPVNSEEEVISEELFSRLGKHPIFNPYDVYQLLDDSWQVISADLEVLQSEGWDKVREVEPNMVLKKKKDKDSGIETEIEIQEGWKGRIMPFALVQENFLADELCEIQAAEIEASDCASDIEDMIRELSDENREKYIEEEDEKLKTKELAAAVKAMKKDPELREEELIALQGKLDQEKELKKRIKKLRDELEQKTHVCIENLTDEDAYKLLGQKWIMPLCKKIFALPVELLDAIERDVTKLTKRYADTLLSVGTEIEKAEKELAAMLGELIGGEADMQAIQELSKMTGNLGIFVLLDKLFPKKGEKVPALRFKEFTEEWIKSPLSDYLVVSTEKNLYNHYTAQDIQSVSGEYGVVNQIEFQGRSFAGASLLGYRVIHHGDIVYTKSPLKQCPYGIIKANQKGSGIVSSLYGVYKLKKGDANFIQYYFDLIARLNGHLRPLVNKGAKNTLLISDEGALAGSVVFPREDEQRKIAKLFIALNHLLSLREKQLTLLKHTKQALLEQMFVNE